MVSIHISLLALYRSLRRHGNCELPNDYGWEPTGGDWIQGGSSMVWDSNLASTFPLWFGAALFPCALVGGLNVNHGRHVTHNPLQMKKIVQTHLALLAPKAH